MSPAWQMKSGSTRWNLLPQNQRGMPSWPNPFSPVHKQRKFSHVRGQSGAKSSISMRPTLFPAMLMSSQTCGLPGLSATSSTVTRRLILVMSGSGFFLKYSSRRPMIARTAVIPANHTQ